jgi:hypothetical protein
LDGALSRAILTIQPGEKIPKGVFHRHFLVEEETLSFEFASCHIDFLLMVLSFDCGENPSTAPCPEGNFEP